MGLGMQRAAIAADTGRYPFVVEVSPDGGKTWTRPEHVPAPSGADHVNRFERAGVAYPFAHRLWLSTAKLVRTGKAFDTYECAVVRVIRHDGRRAVHRFPVTREVWRVIPPPVIAR